MILTSPNLRARVFHRWLWSQDKDVSDISCNFLQLIAVSSPLPHCASLPPPHHPSPPSNHPSNHPSHPPLSPASLLVCVLVLAAAVSPEVKQSAVIYQRVIGPIWEPRKPGPGLWRRSPELIKFQSSAMMNVKKLHPRYRDDVDLAKASSGEGHAGVEEKTERKRGDDSNGEEEGGGSVEEREVSLASVASRGVRAQTHTHARTHTKYVYSSLSGFLCSWNKAHVPLLTSFNSLSQWPCINLFISLILKVSQTCELKSANYIMLLLSDIITWHLTIFWILCIILQILMFFHELVAPTRVWNKAVEIWTNLLPFNMHLLY